MSKTQILRHTSVSSTYPYQSVRKSIRKSVRPSYFQISILPLNSSVQQSPLCACACMRVRNFSKKIRNTIFSLQSVFIQSVVLRNVPDLHVFCEFLMNRIGSPKNGNLPAFSANCRESPVCPFRKRPSKFP